MLLRTGSARLALVLITVLLVAVPLGLVVAQARPGGWIKSASNPVLSVGTPGSWDDEEVWDPAVVYDGNQYRLWYTGGRPSTYLRVGYATSSDGLSWTRPVGAPVLDVGAAGSWEAKHVRFAAVISDTGLFKMWYTGNGTTASQIGHATSPDGVAWTKSVNNPVVRLGTSGSWDDAYVGEPTVIKDGTTYKMWYRGNRSNAPSSIGYATSPDGITWTKYAGNPVLSSSPAGTWDYTLYAPSVILDEGVYRMWYSGGNFAGTAWEIGYATSADGINWTRQGRVIQQGPDGSFDRDSADYPAVLRESNTFKMWYSGADQNYYRIGYASAPALVLTQTVYLPLVFKNATACIPTWADDFGDYHSGWPIDTDADHTLAYAGGEYQMVVKATDAYYWSTPGVQMSDGAIAVTVRFAAAGDNSDNGGILFGKSLDGNDNFYRFTLRRDGQYGIQRHDDSSGWHDLNWGTATGYRPYPATNRLKVIRTGSAITAYLNGGWLATVSDSTYLGSLRVGLAAGTAASGADLRFDDYGVYPVSCSGQVTLVTAGTP